MCHDSALNPKSSAGVPPLSRGHLALAAYFFFDAAFLAALFFGAAFFLACPLAVFTSASCPSSCAAAAFFGLGCFFVNSGALKLCPSKAISVMPQAVVG